DHKIDILASTTVIEVGMDIPDANIMIIENAERYGLAQLHQLRGRIGRSDKKGFCFIIPAKNSSKDVTERLKFFAECNDGFKIAEYDLYRRGPGEVYGNMQSGMPELKIADIFDIDLFKKAKEAYKILNSKDKLENN
ncbi:MAG TPA: DNA helicase RecG, partial [bacterium]|nr:DNA helicase RecG [bacterium]